MRPVLIAVAVAFVTGIAMPSATGSAWRIRKATEEANEYLNGTDRFVDGEVLLYIVEKDPNGIELLPGKPRLRIVDEVRRGGIIDTRTHEIVGRSDNPVVWFNSREGAEVVLHGDHLPPKLLVEGGMGTGKTTDIGQWLWLQALDLIGLPGEFGATAPTTERASFIQQAIHDMWPEDWWAWSERRQTFTLATGHTLRLVSTHQSSKAKGSRIQGYSWLRHVGDELQDCYEENGNIEARGRDAPDGVFKRLNSVTVKDEPGWRTHKDRLLRPSKDGKPPKWGVRRKSIFVSPFVDQEFIDGAMATMTEQEFRRKMGAEDLPSERRTYYAFDRKFNVTPKPALGARDVTEQELARLGYRGFQILMGHDPGLSANTTILLKAYQLPQRDPKSNVLDPPSWWVVGEVATGPGVEEHCLALHQYLRKWNQRGHIFCDPHGTNSKNDKSKPDVTVLKTFINNGFSIIPAAYSPGTSEPGQVPQLARIEMVNVLFRSAKKDPKGEHIRRLFIDCDERGNCLAPGLLASIESQENVEIAGKMTPEVTRKGAGDVTHYTTALGYGLIRIEKPRLADLRGAG